MPWLTDSLATTDALSDVFGDESILRHMLAFEAALAAAEAHAGVIPRAAAEAIAAAAKDAELRCAFDRARRA